MKKIVLIGLLLVVTGPELVFAQDTSRVNLYRFILGVDVPAAPALVAMGRAPTHVLRGSAPKPVAASLIDAFAPGTSATPGVALDVAPYYLAGGGDWRFSAYRSRSVAGRLMRVLIKTILSVGVVQAADDPSSLLVGWGVRSTLHDPHDPVLNSRLPEEVAALLQQHNVPDPGVTQEDVRGLGAPLEPVFTRARQAMRARSGDAQVSAGWGMAGRLLSGSLVRDSLVAVRHTVWLSGQYTAGPRFDILGTVQVREAFRSGAVLWIGAGMQRKFRGVDLLAACTYQTTTRTLHPDLAVDIRLLSNVALVAALTAPATSSRSLVDPSSRKLAFRIALRLFTASDR